MRSLRCEHAAYVAGMWDASGLRLDFPRGGCSPRAAAKAGRSSGDCRGARSPSAVLLEQVVLRSEVNPVAPVPPLPPSAESRD